MDPVARERAARDRRKRNGAPNGFIIMSHTRRGIGDSKARSGRTPIICLTDEDAEGHESRVVQMFPCRSAIPQDFVSWEVYSGPPAWWERQMMSQAQWHSL